MHVHVDYRRSLRDDPTNSHNRLWPDLPPVAVIDPGDELTLDLRDGMDGRGRPHIDPPPASARSDTDIPLTGPIEVRGARVGDLLVVEPLMIEPDTEAATAVLPGFGLLGDLFERRFLVRWKIEDGVARSAQLPGVAIRGRPFLGCVAVAPSFDLLEQARAREEALAKRGGFVNAPDRVGAVPNVEPYASQALRTIAPRENGGNLDVPQVGVGSRLLLPVHVAGAMLSVGDPHFAQGNGEVCGTAIEVAATVSLRVSLRPREEIAWVQRFPAVEFSELPASADARRYFMTMGIPLTDDGQNLDLDLTLAARQALREMVAWLTGERGLTAEQGYLLASVAADLRIAEAVNRPNGVVVCCMPLDVFE